MPTRRSLARAQSLIYVEDQYFWSADVVRSFADALQATPGLRLIAVVPHHPDQDGRLSLPPNLVGRQQALDLIRRAAGDRVAVYGVENPAGTPVYVHAKVCVIDDVWAVDRIRQHQPALLDARLGAGLRRTGRRARPTRAGCRRPVRRRRQDVSLATCG